MNRRTSVEGVTHFRPLLHKREVPREVTEVHFASQDDVVASMLEQLVLPLLRNHVCEALRGYEGDAREGEQEAERKAAVERLQGILKGLMETEVGGHSGMTDRSPGGAAVLRVITAVTWI